MKVFKFIFVLPALMFSLDSYALTYTLSCEWDLGERQPLGAPKYEVRKLAFRHPNTRKWTAAYKLVVKPMNPNAKLMVFSLEEAGSGDEDYNDYNVVDPKDRTSVEVIAIQNQFQWASLADSDGVSAYKCYPAR